MEILVRQKLHFARIFAWEMGDTRCFVFRNSLTDSVSLFLLRSSTVDTPDADHCGGHRKSEHLQFGQATERKPCMCVAVFVKSFAWCDLLTHTGKQQGQSVFGSVGISPDPWCVILGPEFQNHTLGKGFLGDLG